VEFLVVYVGLLVLAPIFAIVERRAPATPGSRSTRALRVDLTYWILTPVFTGTLSRLLIYGVLAVVGWSAGFGTNGPRFLAHAQALTPFSRWPWMVQFPIALVIADFIGYWSHRLRHTFAFWRLHAVHHGASELRALTAARLHPLDEALDATLIGVPVLLLGFSSPVFAMLGPFFVLHTLLLHANVAWSFGPVGTILASPRFHRRHHARDLPFRNYAGVFSLIDVVFGTFEMPERDAAPFGIVEQDVPESVLGQLAYPMKRLLRLP
jgi:sterol desaturase/sphingolipid hydroxylase (fatty acid hydroxylase superfamily)